VQSGAAPLQVSRTNTSEKLLVSPGAKFVAKEVKAPIRPSALIAGTTSARSSASAPALETSIRTVVGVHPAEDPSPVNRLKEAIRIGLTIV